MQRPGRERGRSRGVGAWWWSAVVGSVPDAAGLGWAWLGNEGTGARPIACARCHCIHNAITCARLPFIY